MEVFDISKIFLVRHGQTDANLYHIVQGQRDTPLNQNGRKQAIEVSKRLKNVKADIVISSDLKRAKETAEIISRECDLPLILDKRLREMKLGIWEGKSFEEVMKEPSAQIWSKTPSKWKTEGSETLKDVQERMIDAISEFSRRYDNLIIVSHGIAISTVVAYFKDLSLDSMWEYLPDNTSVIEMDVNFSVKENSVE
ncbi:histidine phosphatase family protein [Mesoaciditoga lauensis]|uniref:histidine phosphatase family protein n=1 Tax=Mesoaciditoga lauensis TaxID=1495039 RepID=UPI00068F8DFC|nr:histidine phosphatase family protein [Mesoaciditoga lauensis]